MQANATSTRTRIRFRALNDPIYWWLTARSFGAAADRIWSGIPQHEIDPFPFPGGPDGWEHASPSHTQTSVYVFLAALALENILKAEFFRQKLGDVHDGALPKGVKTHSLEHLAALAGLVLAEDERRLLSVCSEAATSWGRYPGGADHKSGDLAPPVGFDIREFRNTFESLFGRLEAIVTQDFPDESEDVFPW